MLGSNRDKSRHCVLIRNKRRLTSPPLPAKPVGTHRMYHSYAPSFSKSLSRPLQNNLSPPLPPSLECPWNRFSFSRLQHLTQGTRNAWSGDLTCAQPHRAHTLTVKRPITCAQPHTTHPRTRVQAQVAPIHCNVAAASVRERERFSLTTYWPESTISTRCLG